MFTSKYASRHSRVHFFSMSASKSAGEPRRKVLGSRGVLYILTSAPSGHSGVQVFISHLPSWFCTRRFSEPTFRPFSEPTFRPSGATRCWRNMEEHSVSRRFYLFVHLDLLSTASVSSDSFSCLAALTTVSTCVSINRKFDFQTSFDSTCL